MMLSAQHAEHGLQLPHGVCYLWDPALVWLHAGADTLIAASYFTIPLSLLLFVRRRRDLPFNWMMVLFATFILACGLTHVLGVLNIWVPSWWTTGAVKAVTALASMPTAVLLARLVPQLVALPSPAQLQSANAALNTEIQERLKVEAELRRTQAELEQRVEARTAELARANASLRLLESAVRHASDGVAITTMPTPPAPPKIVFANPAVSRMTGHALDDLVGSSLAMLHGPQTDQAVLAAERRAMAAGEEFTGEATHYRRDGTEFLMSWRSAPVREADGAVTHYVAVQRDVTDQRLLERQLRQAQKMEAVGQLAGGVAHDFNNLLTAIQGNCSLLLDELPEGDERRGLVSEIDDASGRATRLTRQLLAFSRRQVRQPTALNLNTVIGDALPLLERLVGGRITLQFRPGDALGAAWADPDQIEQVLLNLAVNARDAMPGGGALAIETGNVELDAEYAGMHLAVIPGPYVMLSVSDTGSGIAPEHLPHIFEPFFTTKEAGKGTGLGLATVYGIVKQHRGNIFVYSEPGLGTTFRVYLPRVRESEAPEVRRPAEESGVVPGEGVVLVVEDDAAVRALAVRILRRAGYTVLEANDAEFALAVIRDSQRPIDLMLTDVVMPGLSGPALARTVRTLRPGMAIAYMSGYTDSALDEDELKRAGTVFISKPFTPHVLTAAIARARAREA